MAINKVVYGNDTLMDLTNDTVEASNLLEGETAHDRSGQQVQGTAKQGHVFQGQAGTDMVQRAKAQFLDAQVIDDSTNGKTKVEVVKQLTKAQLEALGSNTDGIYETTDEEDEEITGGGHAIEDADGTLLTQRDTMQFKGTIRSYDDPTNQKTVIDDTAVEISWDDWQDMTEQEREAYLAEHPKVDVIGFPDADADLQLDFMTKLWENSDPTSAFGAQNITLDSGDYDYLLVTYITGVSFTTVSFLSVIIEKGKNAFLHYANTTNGTNVSVNTRVMVYNSDTSYACQDCYTQTNGGNRGNNNNYCVPATIYGFKQKITVTVDAIAEDVSTSASKCMLDENTSVADALTYSENEHVVGKWIDGSTLYEKTIDFGYLPNATSKSVSLGANNVNVIVSVNGVAQRFSDGSIVTLPEASSSNTSYNIELTASRTSINIFTAYNYSAYYAYVTLRYTKTS